VAVTGSVGKTTMLHLLEVQLGSDAHYSHFANSAFGISFDILGLRGVTDTRWRWLLLALMAPIRAFTHARHEPIYVVEIDGERPDEVDFVASWLQPEVTLWVSLGHSHAVYFEPQVASGRFPDVETAITHEFSRLATHTSRLVIANGDEPRIANALQDIQARVELVQKDIVTDYHVQAQSTEFMTAGGSFRFTVPLPRETATQLAMIQPLMRHLSREVVYDMSEFHMPPGRSSFLHGVLDTKLIDSTYNAHLISMVSVIDMVDAMDEPHKWFVLGDMIQQGSAEADQHEQLARRLATSSAERIILVGSRMKRHVLPVLQAADVSAKISSFDEPISALDAIQTELSGGETILLKGSQYIEWIAEKLLADPSDVAKLSRQDPATKRRRIKRGLA
jgi:UDP-N-acetylmuramoyl-tripeptide--D-alanyl-D-alanine ligase